MKTHTLNPYYCKHCGKTVYRDSDKKWVKSYCVFASKKVHLIKIKSNNMETDEDISDEPSKKIFQTSDEYYGIKQ